MASQTQAHQDTPVGPPHDRPVRQPDPELRRNPAELDVQEGQERMQSDSASSERSKGQAKQ